jgi:OmcA/MtrC family decaheme c-type cytochrome
MSISKHISARLGLLALIVGSLAGCGGGDGGGDGAAPPGPVAGAPPVITSTAPANSTATNPNQAFGLVQAGGGTVVTVNSPPVLNFTVIDSDGKPVTGLALVDKTAGANLDNCGTGSGSLRYARNVRAAIAKLVPGGIDPVSGTKLPDQWQNLIYALGTSANNGGSTGSPLLQATTDPTPSTTNNAPQSKLAYKDGVYTYTFNTDVRTASNTNALNEDGTANPNQWTSTLDSTGATVTTPVKATGGVLTKADRLLTRDATTTYRVALQLCYLDKGVKVFANPTYDFTVDANGLSHQVTDTSKTRKMVDKASCNECHSPISAHGGGRVEPDYCVMCHNPSTVDKTASPTSGAAANTTVDFKLMVHKIHMGKHLMNGFKVGNANFSEVGFPQDVRNCTKCHDNSTNATHKTAQGDNWKNVPSRNACGACHDGINFATGLGTTLDGNAGGKNGHVGGAQADDTKCALCHNAGNIPIYHVAVTPPYSGNSYDVAGGNANSNAAWIASNDANLPAGAIKISYDLNSVSVVSGRPTMRFRMLQNGTATPFNAPGGELWPNFIGSPSAYFVWSVPQDGIAAPADFNANASCYLKNGWNGTATSGTGACTVVADGTTGYYIATLTGVTIPANAKMLTGGLGYTYSLTSTQPLTQTNVAGYLTRACGVAANGNKCGGLIVPAPDAKMVATGYTGRRAIVDNAKCNLCHAKLGEFTDEAFHAGQRNDGESCSWCHKPNQASSGWSADSANFVHAIHGASKRTVPFTWHATDSADNFGNIGFPGDLKKCETCHVPGSYDFSAAASASAVPNRLYRTLATGTFNSTDANFGISYSPYVKALITANGGTVNFGSGFTYNAATGVVTAEAAGTTLVDSPIATACFSCHDGNMVSIAGVTVKDHIEQNGGGSIYQPRSSALAKPESCLNCHGPSALAPIKAMHAK